MSNISTLKKYEVEYTTRSGEKVYIYQIGLTTKNLYIGFAIPYEKEAWIDIRPYRSEDKWIEHRIKQLQRAFIKQFTGRSLKSLQSQFSSGILYFKNNLIFEMLPVNFENNLKALFNRL
jgi:RNA polymerase-interacting CarD/CdnL/TRCF family regulator